MKIWCQMLLPAKNCAFNSAYKETASEICISCGDVLFNCPREQYIAWYGFQNSYYTKVNLLDNFL